MQGEAAPSRMAGSSSGVTGLTTRAEGACPLCCLCPSTSVRSLGAGVSPILPPLNSTKVTGLPPSRRGIGLPRRTGAALVLNRICFGPWSPFHCPDGSVLLRKTCLFKLKTSVKLYLNFCCSIAVTHQGFRILTNVRCKIASHRVASTLHTPRVHF